MKMINEKFETNGGRNRLYTVRSMGPGRGFGILDRCRKMFVTTAPLATREECWDYLRQTDAKSPEVPAVYPDYPNDSPRGLDDATTKGGDE